MKCPKCGVELRIKSNNPVRRKDGSFSYKMIFTCQNKACANYLLDVDTEYTPMEIVDDNSEE